MNITDAITITELSRLLQKSRPTIYKYVLDYESGETDAVPALVKELFRQIEEEDLPKDEIVRYCNTRFGSPDAELDPRAKEAIDFIKANQRRIDFDRLMKLLGKALR